MGHDIKNTDDRLEAATRRAWDVWIEDVTRVCLTTDRLDKQLAELTDTLDPNKMLQAYETMVQHARKMEQRCDKRSVLLANSAGELTALGCDPNEAGSVLKSIHDELGYT